MRWPVRGANAALLLLSSFLAAGCGGGPSATAVSGKLLENGEPVKPMQGGPPGDKGWRLSFALADPAEKNHEPQYAQISDDGSFRVDGPNRKGIPPGKYRLSVQKGPMGKAALITITDVVEVPRASSVTIEVDAGKKTARVMP
jgi:hypothetical protein